MYMTLNSGVTVEILQNKEISTSPPPIHVVCGKGAGAAKMKILYIDK